MVDNKLSLHLGKTELILFGSFRKLSKVNNFRIKCDDHVIDAVKSVKYLGLELDQTLSGESFANKIIKKANGRLKFFYRQGNCLNFKCRKLLSSALIQCHFDYSCSAWYAGISKNTKTQLQVTQNKIIRFIKNLPPRSHIGQKELASIGWLNVENRVKLLRLNHVHKIFYCCSAPYLSEHFVRVSDFHRYRTRGSFHRFVVPLAKSVAAKSFFFTGIQDWNSLPNSLQAIQNNKNFKSTVKKYLSSQIQR